MSVVGLYDTHVMGYRVKIMPHVIGIFDDENIIDGDRIPNKIVRYLIEEGFCDTWLKTDMGIRINIYRQNNGNPENN